mmetsp:Transcript_13427/g.37142  ORF Transcript_13427/g.37142 Transcript_13427/m.37142 type:complete len:148 (-) Transcript_13427:80-523(-)|eukprot:CAMPEP_0179170672 /NCGR_PEP_ID=MMETSP0796-20121207/84093_1 /TAXON_ID=73915 /ORGANISM="Pyrodinium bahamense, Strain pbaha01" /LENGTH=147 /DNA_ID=CAMNT_0020873675 /DNA_START=81 /DNA_END=524 /DNA_ORIENTATION=+
MVLSLLPFPHMVVALAQFGYPLVCLIEKAKSSAPLRDLDYVQWTMYWVICALWTFVETTFLWFVVDYFPLFLELKLVFFAWLLHPDYLGAAYLWYGKLQPIHKKLDDQHYANIIGILERAKVPDVAKAQPPTSSDKKEVIERELKGK